MPSFLSVYIENTQSLLVPSNFIPLLFGEGVNFTIFICIVISTGAPRLSCAAFLKITSKGFLNSTYCGYVIVESVVTWTMLLKVP